MKNAPRGPFERIRYFCFDGQNLDPKAFACEKSGGGYQHGEWSARTQRIRAAGYPIANLLVMVDPKQLANPDAQGVDPDLLPILLVERFLVASDNGWVFRKAQSYRGAIQDHNEKEAARTLLQALATGNASFVDLREAARAFPHGADTPSLSKVRGMATSLNDKDSGFLAMRSRIHNAPESGDAARVRAYASSSSAKPALKAEYSALANAIDAAYQPPPLSVTLGRLGRVVRDEKGRKALQALVTQSAAAERAGGAEPLTSSAEALVWLRDHAFAAARPAERVAVVDASLSAEATFLIGASRVLPTIATLSREARLKWLGLAGRSQYGIGLLTDRERDSLAQSLKSQSGEVTLANYRADLEYLERASSWSTRRLEYHFGAGVQRLLPIEPLAAGFVPDRLRSSPLLFYSSVLQTLREDADRLTGASQKLFGEAVGGGLRRLNPGLARGVLRAKSLTPAPNGAPAIFLVPETTSDLPAAAGILTEEEGNPVSHVQLLARNLGIPNVVVSRELIPRLDAFEGKLVVVAASVGGLVEIAENASQWDAVLGKGEAKPSVVIVPDLVKLNLLRADFVSTASLRASDSGRIVGPKAAHVGELSHRFEGQVSPGLAVTFGVYRELLNEPVKAGGEPMFDWMKKQYADIAVRRRLDPSHHEQRVNGFLQFVRGWIAQQPIPPALLIRLRQAMLERFGLEGTYGVFVRSDTNIEDLPGFTGAGLNLTLPNVVGFEPVVKALRSVWASPFTERAYGWRQDLMDQPEHVYVSVLLHETVPNDKSGVMITADIDTGSRERITVATSLGVGGGVDGEASETLHVELLDGKAQLLSSATARTRRVLPSAGGAQMAPAAAPDAVLGEKEIEMLAGFAQKLPEKYPFLHDDEGKDTPADVEFGFVGGKLMLQQIRPFLQNRSAGRQDYLAGLDQQLRRNDNVKVDLRKLPESGK